MLRINRLDILELMYIFDSNPPWISKVKINTDFKEQGNMVGQQKIDNIK